MDVVVCNREAASVRAIDVVSHGARGSDARGRLAIKWLRKALVAYHPDKNRAEKYGVHWAALCEELAKLASELLAEEQSAAQERSERQGGDGDGDVTNV